MCIRTKEQQVHTKSKPKTELHLETGHVAGHHTTLQTVFRALTPVSGPPQIPGSRSVSLHTSYARFGGIAYAPPSDSTWLFLGLRMFSPGLAGVSWYAMVL